MNDIIKIIVVIAAIACAYLAQHKSTPKSSQRVFSLLGGVASSLIAYDAKCNDQPGVFLFFAAAALLSFGSVILFYLKTGKTDA